jgi:uncharacterized Zn finger protein
VTESFSAPFTAMFEALRMGPVFARGRRDARAGHVRHLMIAGSLVVAQVRGPEDLTAYRARLAVRAFGAAEWSRVESDLAASARFAADLLGGRVPADIETVFAGAGLSLLPLSLGEVAMDCACDQRPMPCAHVAATIYAVAAAFDTDPFEAFAWRGRSRDELLSHLRALRGPAPESDPPPAAAAGLGELDAFWGSDEAPALLPAPAAGRPDALLDQLDPPPIPTPDGRPVIDLLRPAYRALG